MKENFFKSKHCLSGVHCISCRTSEKFRASIAEHFDVGAAKNFPCPHGKDNDSTITLPELKPDKIGCKKCSRKSRT